jgi:hypothetical protein
MIIHTLIVVLLTLACIFLSLKIHKEVGTEDKKEKRKP